MRDRTYGKQNSELISSWWGCAGAQRVQKKLLIEQRVSMSVAIRSFQLLFYQAHLPLSSSSLRYMAGVVRAHRRAAGVRWRRDCRDQALVTLAYLWKGETYADLAEGFGVSVATVYPAGQRNYRLVGGGGDEPVASVAGPQARWCGVRDRGRHLDPL